MKQLSRIFALAAFAVAATGAMADGVVGVDARLAASGNLVAVPDPVVVSDPNGIAMFRTINITNTGPGIATNLFITVQRTQGSLGQMFLQPQTNSCTGASLGPNGSCTIRPSFSGTCPKPETSKWNIIVTSPTAPTLTIPVTLASTGGTCE